MRLRRWLQWRIYTAPYKPKRRTRTTIAKERGLEPLANVITLQMLNTPLEAEAAKFINPEKSQFRRGCDCRSKDIIAEAVSDEADLPPRESVTLTMKKGHVDFHGKRSGGGNLFVRCIMSLMSP